MAESSAAAVRTPDGSEHGLRRRVEIGRDGANDVVLAARSVSRRHAVLLWNEDRWCIEDVGSANGTFVNATRIPFGAPHPLRHGDRIRLGSEELVFSWPAQGSDPDRTDELEPPGTPAEVSLSAFQLQVVRALCGAWLSGESLDVLPSNRQIAEQLGTPDGAETVKAALRRVYAKTGVAGLPPHAKRRALCRIAHARGWLR